MLCSRLESGLGTHPGSHSICYQRCTQDQKIYHSYALNAYDRLWYHFDQYEVSHGKTDTLSDEGDIAELRHCMAVWQDPLVVSWVVIRLLNVVSAYLCFVSTAGSFTNYLTLNTLST